MESHKLGGVPIIGEVLRIFGPVHSDIQIFANFKVEVSQIHPPVVAHFTNEITLFNDLPLPNGNALKVAVEAVDDFQNTGLLVCMTDDDDIAPAKPDITRKDDVAVTHGENRVPKIGVSTSETIPVVPKMPVGSETSGFVKPLGIRFSNRVIKSIG